MAAPPELKPHPAYAAAFAQVMKRVEDALGPARPPKPVVAAVAGGAALHFYTGGRISRDIDATLDARVLLNASDLRIAYKDADGGVKMLYYDTQYSDSMALLHEDAHEDALPLAVGGIDPRRLQVRLLTPVDLAVSKLSRFGEQDREDIRALAREGLVTESALRRRATEALAGYMGDPTRIRNTIDIACRDVAAIAGKPSRRKGR